MEEVLPNLRIPLPDDERARIDPASLFEDKRAVWMEVGFGGGEHLAAQAAANPDVGFIGCEPFVNGVASLLSQVEGLDNIRLFDDDARLLLPRLAPDSVSRFFLLFPDPWPKARHHKRRFINPANLDLIADLLVDGGQFRFSSDHMGYVRWTLARVTAHPAFRWTAKGPGDWRERLADAPPTRYETKALEGGSRCVHLVFQRTPRT